MNVRVTDPTVELDFPKVNEPLDWTDYDKTPFIQISVVCGLRSELPVGTSLYGSLVNVCPRCMQQGIWGHIKHHSIDVDTDSLLCRLSRRRKRSVQWTWGIVKTNDAPHIGLPCNGAHSPIEYPVVVPVSERIGDGGDNRLTVVGRTDVGPLCTWNVFELVRSLSQVVVGPTWSFTQRLSPVKTYLEPASLCMFLTHCIYSRSLRDLYKVESPET